MICPWLIDTVVETNNRNSYNDSRRSEKSTFGKCVQKDCPFYSENDTHTKCLRARALVLNSLPLEEM